MNLTAFINLVSNNSLMDRICGGVGGDQTKRQSGLDLITSTGNSVSVRSLKSMMYV